MAVSIVSTRSCMPTPCRFLAIDRGLERQNKTEFSQKLLNRTKNSLKHANSEEEQFASFNEEEAVIRLILAVANFQTGAGRPFSERMTKFETWLRVSVVEKAVSGAAQ